MNVYDAVETQLFQKILKANKLKAIIIIITIIINVHPTQGVLGHTRSYVTQYRSTKKGKKLAYIAKSKI